jgi:hypothetical protein
VSIDQPFAARSFAFGSLDDAVWGACWLSLPFDDGRRWATGGETHRLAVGREPHRAAVEVSVSLGGPDEPWQVRGDGVELTLTPASPPPPATEDRHPGVDQLCHVEGRLELDGTSSLACPGWRSIGELGDVGGVESFRQLAAWFGPDTGLALLSVRPRSAKGQDHDVITAVTFDLERPQLVVEPRLSTTYDAAGRPLRAGLELWLAGPPGLDGAPAPEQHSRRAAGQAVAGRPVTWQAGPLELAAELFRWYSAGHEGTGVYLTGVLR